MSISSVQKKIKTDEYIVELAQKGIKPNNYEVNKMLTEHFDNHIMGMPYYTPIMQKPYDVSSKDDYNHNFSSMDEDLKTIYCASTEANNTAIAMQEYYDSEKIRIMQELDNLALRIKNASSSLKANRVSEQYVESFNNYYNIEFYGDTDRNIPYTTCFTDLLQKNAYIPKINNSINKININDATITIIDDKKIAVKPSKGNINDILNDIFNEYVMITCTSEDGNSSKSITIDIDFGKDILFNAVLFKYTSATSMVNTLYLSEDGNTYVPTYDISTPMLAEWNFPEKKVRFIRIKCVKEEADGISSINSSTEINQYYFLFKNISIAYEKYSKTSVLVTKPISFENIISSIKLDAEDMIFSHTRIDYFIGYDNGSNKIGWDAIKNHSEHELYMFEKKNKIANAHVEKFAHNDLLLDGYAIFELPRYVNTGTIKVIPGYNMWDVRRYNDAPSGFSLSGNDITSYVNNSPVVQMFMDCERYTDFEIKTNTLYVFTQYVCLDKAEIMNNRSLMVALGNKRVSTAEIKVFVNGYETAKYNNNFYSFMLRKGTNKIQIAIYCPSRYASIYTLKHNINMKTLTNDVFAMPPMKYANNATLSAMPNDSYKYYTIKDHCIYVKPDPRDMARSYLTDMPYFIKFSSLKPDLNDLFKDGKFTFRLMAVFNTEDNNVSPRLNNIRITGR